MLQYAPRFANREKQILALPEMVGSGHWDGASNGAVRLFERGLRGSRVVFMLELGGGTECRRNLHNIGAVAAVAIKRMGYDLRKA